MKKFFKDLFTLADGTSYDLGRVLWALGVIWYLALGIFAILLNKQAFNFVEAGTGLGLALAGGGAALWAKRDTEPKNGLD